MNIHTLLNRNIPQLQLQDKVVKALNLMEDFDVNHLCVVHKDKYIGIVSKEDLLNEDEQSNVEILQDEFLTPLVFENDHFSKAVLLITQHKLSLIPVLNTEKDFIGVLLATDLLYHLSNFIGANENGGIIVLEMERRNYSFSEISRLVETNDALITQLNAVEYEDTGLMEVTLKLNKKEISDIIATLQRYEYNVIAYYGEETYANELQENYNHLLHYINI
jgi:acetoin utilization protein AcuB